MASPKRLELTALLGLALQAAFLLACLALAGYSGSRAARAEVWHMAPGLLIWFLVLVHGRQRRLARQEREERERLKETRLSEEIFEETELDITRASTGLLIFERYFVPFFSVLFSGMLVFFAYRLFTSILGETWTLKRDTASAVGIGMVFIAFFGFLIGKYAAGLAQNRGYRLLRAGASYILGNVLSALLIAVAMAMHYFGVTWGETVVAHVIPVLMALVGVEVLLNLILDIYRPRVEGQEVRPPYDSRLLGLFAEPQGVLRTVAATLDYQFGFQVSETWFYRFMERAILPLLLVWLASLWLLTTLVVVEPDEIVFIETFGVPRVTTEDAARGLKATVYGAGFYLKAPWPISVARHVPAYQVHGMAVGKILEPMSTIPLIRVMKDPDIILWRELHIPPTEGFEASFLVPSTADLSADPLGEGATAEGQAARRAPRVNLARLEAVVYWRVKQDGQGRIDEDAAFKYQYHHADVPRHLEKLAYRELCHVAASQDFLKWIAEERRETAERLTRELKRSVAEADLGVEVLECSIPAIHPPAEVARPYEAVVTALEMRETLIHEGEQNKVRIVQEALARKEELLAMASGYAYTLTNTAQAETELFLAQLDAQRKAPLVYAYRTYFDTLEEALENQRLFVVPVSASEVQIIDLEEKLKTQLLEGLEVLEE